MPRTRRIYVGFFFLHYPCFKIKHAKKHARIANEIRPKRCHMKWFKHYNTAHEGHLVGNLLAAKQYDAVALWWVILEVISKFEDAEKRGECTIPVARIAQIMHMKPSRIERLLAEISLVSHSDLDCDMSEKQPRNATFRLRNWLKLQENRGKKKVEKNDENPTEVRGKKLDVRSNTGEGQENVGVVVDFKKPDDSLKPEGLSSSAAHHLSMTEEAGKVKQWIRENKFHNLKNYTAHIINTFETLDEFYNFVTNLSTIASYPKDPVQQKRYETAAVLRAIGVRTESRAANE